MSWPESFVLIAFFICVVLVVFAIEGNPFHKD